MNAIRKLQGLAADLTRSMAARDRYARLVTALSHALPADAVAVLRLEGSALKPLAVHGLVPEVLGQQFALADHPRLETLCAAAGPHRFPETADLPDPFDGLIARDAPHLTSVHSCMGIPLRIDEDLVGVVTADALQPGAFAALDDDFLACLGTLATAALRSGMLLEMAESQAEERGSLAARLLESQQGGLQDLLGRSPALERIRSEIELVAATELAVLITGETGVGKEQVATAVHRTSARSQSAIVHVNCASLPAALAESELFGHVRGAFTGADRERQGRFVEADGGTLFLDEIGELPMSLQPKLLRVLQQGEVVAVGRDRPQRVDVRIVAATNRDLVREIDAGRFRSDLYHRLCQFPIHVPPLRERTADVPVLAGLFAERARRQLGTSVVRITPEAHGELSQHPWPGNVRELQNVIARAVLKAQRPGARHVVLDAEHIRAELGSSAATPTAASPAARGGTAHADDTRPLAERLEQFKRDTIAAALSRHDGNLAAAARELGVARSNLYVTARRLGLRG